jgi:uncharacterized protein YxeA
MNSLFKLEIPKRNAYCSHGGERLLPGMEIYSLILEGNAQRLARRDFCCACWQQVQGEGGGLEPCSYWKSKIEQRKSVVASSRIERALTLLRDLQQASEQQEAEIFVLCLFLSHARQLALRQEFQKEEVTYQLYEILRKEEYLTIKALNLSHTQIEEIQKSLAYQLQS